MDPWRTWPFVHPLSAFPPSLKGSLHRRVRELLTITPPRILHEPPDIMPPGTQRHAYVSLCVHTPSPLPPPPGRLLARHRGVLGAWKVWLKCATGSPNRRQRAFSVFFVERFARGMLDGGGRGGGEKDTRVRMTADHSGVDTPRRRVPSLRARPRRIAKRTLPSLRSAEMSARLENR